MANQKTYKITIDGISKSIGEVEALGKEIASLEERLSRIGKGSKISIGGDVGVAKELAKQAKLQSDEYKFQLQELEKIKAENKAIAQQQKEIALGIRDSNGEYTNTLGGQRAYLSELKKQLSSTDLGTEDWLVLRDRVAEVNANVKELEQSYGVFTRNVGNYQDAANGFVSLKESVTEADNALEQLRQNAKFQVDLNGQIIEFENLSQAIGEIDDLAQKASAQMQMLAAAGQENSDAYREAAEIFQTYVSKAGELEKARKYSDEMKDSLASQSRTLDLTVQGFQSVVGVMQVAAGVQGLFGKDQEELNEAMNKTVQLMGIAQGVQELYNQAVQSGTFLNKAFALSQKGVNAAIKAMGLSAKSSTVAVKGLKIALNSIGIGLLISGISLLVEHWEDLVGWFGKAVGGADKLKNTFDSLKRVLMGVGNVVLEFIISPFQGAFQAIKQMFQGDFSGAFYTMNEALRNQFALRENFNEGYTYQANKQAEKRAENELKQLVKVQKETIEANEAKYGSDYKYTKEGKKLYDEYYANLLKTQKKDSEEYRKTVNEKVAYDREYNEKLNKSAKEREKNIEEAAKRELEVWKDAQEKRIAKEKEFYSNLQENISIENEGKRAESLSASYKLERLKKEYEEFSDASYLENDFISPLGTIANSDEEVLKNIEHNLQTAELHYLHYADVLSAITYDINKIKNEKLNIDYADSLNELGSSYQQTLLDIKKEISGSTALTEIAKTMENIFSATMSNNVELQLEYKEKYQKLIASFISSDEILIENREEIYKKLTLLFQQFIKKEELLDTEYHNNQEKNLAETQDNRLAIQVDTYEGIIEVYKQQYDELTSMQQEYLSSIDSGDADLNVFAKIIGNETFLNKYKTSFDALSNHIKNTINELKEKSKELTKLSLTEGINLEDLNKDQKEINELIKNLEKLLEKISDKSELEFQEIIQIVNAGINYIFNAFNNLYSAISTMQYENEMHRIEQLEEALDAENDVLEDKLSKQEEIFERHNDKINDIEGELEDARGSRRTFLLQKLAEEIQAREQAFGVQQAIQKQQEQLEKKKQALQEQADAAEKKRNRQQKVMDIASASVNTALGVTNALRVQPIALGIALASIVGALGAAQIGIIAATKYADGGVLQGNSHANGGVKVLGGTAEVEGGEFITNKSTTTQNVDLLEFINTKKRRINLADFIEFYYGKSTFSANRLNYNNHYRYADGGQLPKSIDNRNVNYITDDRPIVVSVVEIENVMQNVRNVRALAGIENN